MKLYPNDWRLRLTNVGVIAACIVAVKTFGPGIGIHGFWSILVATLVGILLGNFVGPLLFRPSSDGPSDHPPRD